MSNFYSKAVVEIKVGTMGANTDDFVSTVQVEKRLDELDVLKRNIQYALEFIENEEKGLRMLLERG
ncbi:hypothetical protein ABNX05_11200 [Lysinibacillus sp. M3]|uniref:Uncharacterized protein n=1 Tax=Lysinibacillus zambalensis TaxID=3160866 RepID=A0ABV1MRP4_9BACI